MPSRLNRALTGLPSWVRSLPAVVATANTLTLPHGAMTDFTAAWVTQSEATNCATARFTTDEGQWIARSFASVLLEMFNTG